MMIFMTKKMAQAAAKEQEKRDKETKAIRNLSIAAVAIGGVNLVRGVVGNISAHRDLKAIKNTVLTWDEYFKTAPAEDDEAEGGGNGGAGGAGGAGGTGGADGAGGAA